MLKPLLKRTMLAAAVLPLALTLLLPHAPLAGDEKDNDARPAVKKKERASARGYLPAFYRRVVSLDQSDATLL